MSTIKTKCEDDARRIAAEKDSCMNDLAKAQPFVDQVRDAVEAFALPPLTWCRSDPSVAEQPG